MTENMPYTKQNCLNWLCAGVLLGMPPQAL
jgi:hypothetical protein